MKKRHRLSPMPAMHCCQCSWQDYSAAMYLIFEGWTSPAPKRVVMFRKPVPLAALPCLKMVRVNPYSSDTVPYSL